jgi:hypothetical protein
MEVRKWIHKQNVFIIEQYFESKSFAADYEAFSIAYPDKET